MSFLVQHFKVHQLDGFGLRGMVAAINAAGAFLRYLQETLCLPIHQIQEIQGLFSLPFHGAGSDDTAQSWN